MKKAASKLLSLLLALTMLAGLLPGKALAAGEDYRFGTLQYFSKMTKEYTGDTYYEMGGGFGKSGFSHSSFDDDDDRFGF